MITDTMPRIDKMIRDYVLVISEGKIESLTGQKLDNNADDRAYLKDNEEAFLSRITELDLREAEMLKNVNIEDYTLSFDTSGNTPQLVKCFTLGRIDVQLLREAQRVGCTYESLLEDYKQLCSLFAAAFAENERVEKVTAMAAKTGEKQVLRKYTEEVTVWAMPDGSETVTRERIS